MTATVAAPVGASAKVRPSSDSLAGLGTMVRLVIRRNRVRMSVWFLVLVVMFQYIVTFYKAQFPTQQSLDDFATVANTPAIKALTGLSPAANTMGGAVWTKGWMTVVVTIALVVVFLTTRNGRADEEVGRTEVLRSRMLGVHAYSAASWLVNAALCLALGVFIAIVSIGGNLDPAGTGITGSLIMGASITGIGLVGLGVGAVAGQVATTSRGANALASIVIAAFYVLRMIGDLGNGVLTWFSPIGWGQHMQPYGGNHWWPLALLLAFSALLLVAAYWLEGTRDYGAGLIAEKPGKPVAPARFASPLGLALRLQRNPIIGWTAAVVICSILFGSIVQAMADALLKDGGRGVDDLLRGDGGLPGLLALLVSVMALITLVFALQTTVSLRSDEASGIIEPQLAGAVSRWRWALQRLVIPAGWSALLLVVGGYLLGAVYGSTVHDSSQGGELAMAALAYWPAVMVFVGLGVLLWGYLPQFAIPIAWGVVAAMWFLTMFGEVFRLPQWLLNVLPLRATPALPAEPMSWTPLVVMTLIAVALTWIGLDRFSRRDIQPA